MEYTKSNLEVNRLQLVSSFTIFSSIPLLRFSMVFSSLGSCPVRPTFTSLGLFMVILKESVNVHNQFFYPAN